MQEWFDRAASEATEPLAFKGIRLEYQVEHHFVPQKEELDRLRAAVRNHPDHPERLAVAGYERRLKQGADRSRYTLWFWESGFWRSSYDDDMDMWYDSVLAPKSSWRLSPDQLTLLDPGGPPPPGFDTESEELAFLESLRFFFYGGLQLVASMQLKPRPIQATSRGWEVRADGPMDSVLLFRGDWDRQSGTGRVRELVLERVPPSPGEEGMRWKIEDWTDDALLGRPIARRVEEWSKAGRLVYRAVFLRAIPEPEERLKELVITPEFDGSDPIRGELTVRAVSDFRSASPLHSRVTSAGLEPVLAQANPRQQWRDWLRVLGWGSLVALGFLLFFFNKHRRASRRAVA